METSHGHAFIVTSAGKPVIDVHTHGIPNSSFSQSPKCFLESRPYSPVSTCGLLATVCNHYYAKGRLHSISRPNQRLAVASLNGFLFVIVIVCSRHALSERKLRKLCEWLLLHLQACLTAKHLKSLVSGRPNIDLTSYIHGTEPVFQSAVQRYLFRWPHLTSMDTPTLAADSRSPTMLNLRGFEGGVFAIVFQPPHQLVSAVPYTNESLPSAQEIQMLLNWFVSDDDRNLRESYSNGKCWLPMCIPSVNEQKFCHIYFASLGVANLHIIVAHSRADAYYQCDGYARAVARSAAHQAFGIKAPLIFESAQSSCLLLGVQCGFVSYCGSYLTADAKSNELSESLTALSGHTFMANNFKALCSSLFPPPFKGIAVRFLLMTLRNGRRSLCHSILTETVDVVLCGRPNDQVYVQDCWLKFANLYLQLNALSL